MIFFGQDKKFIYGEPKSLEVEAKINTNMKQNDTFITYPHNG